MFSETNWFPSGLAWMLARRLASFLSRAPLLHEKRPGKPGPNPECWKDESCARVLFNSNQPGPNERKLSTALKKNLGRSKFDESA